MKSSQLASVAPPELTFVGDAQQEVITDLSGRQRDRLEAAGRFPKSVRLGEGRNGRKARILAEVLAWNAARIAERDSKMARNPGVARVAEAAREIYNGRQRAGLITANGRGGWRAFGLNGHQIGEYPSAGEATTAVLEGAASEIKSPAKSALGDAR